MYTSPEQSQVKTGVSVPAGIGVATGMNIRRVSVGVGIVVSVGVTVSGVESVPRQQAAIARMMTRIEMVREYFFFTFFSLAILLKARARFPTNTCLARAASLLVCGRLCEVILLWRAVSLSLSTYRA